MAGFRKARVADQLCAFLAEEVRRLTDPRLELVTITSVDVSPDLKSARVYWTVPVLAQAGAPVLAQAGAPVLAQAGGEEEAGGGSEDDDDPERFFPDAGRVREVEAGFASAERYLKRRIGSELKLRYVPHLDFRYDESLARGARLEFLLAQSKERP